MVDFLDRAGRSRLMSRVRGKDTGPELRVRRTAHALGLRFRLQRRDLPGTPDLVFPSRRVAVLVHGCFWHRHTGCRLTTTPKTRLEYWRSKFAANVERDVRKASTLGELGWGIVVIWECETRDLALLERIIGERIASVPKVAERRSTTRHR